MTYRGYIKNGMAVLEQPIQLPDGTPVSVEVLAPAADFWQDKSIDQLAREQGVPPGVQLADLTGTWPPDEAVDEFLDFLREARR